jgi:hypothetical protein
MGNPRKVEGRRENEEIFVEEMDGVGHFSECGCDA